MYMWSKDKVSLEICKMDIKINSHIEIEAEKCVKERHRSEILLVISIVILVFILLSTLGAFYDSIYYYLFSSLLISTIFTVVKRYINKEIDYINKCFFDECELEFGLAYLYLYFGKYVGLNRAYLYDFTFLLIEFEYVHEAEIVLSMLGKSKEKKVILLEKFIQMILESAKGNDSEVVNSCQIIIDQFKNIKTRKLIYERTLIMYYVYKKDFINALSLCDLLDSNTYFGYYIKYYKAYCNKNLCLYQDAINDLNVIVKNNKLKRCRKMALDLSKECINEL